MTKGELWQAIKQAVPRAVHSTQDGLGTKVSPHYVEVFVPRDDVPLLDAICASLGRKAVYIAVLCHSPGWTHRTIRVNPT